jgi:hypothetical protein
MQPKVRRAGALAHMPSGPGVDQLAAALAAAEVSGDLRHVHVFGRGVDAHVGLVVAGFACGGDRPPRSQSEQQQATQSRSLLSTLPHIA